MLGQTTDGVTSFKGIPYAKPPVGDLRWKAPEAPDPSDEEIECYDFGYTALQYEWPTEPASSFPKNEDCLTLNIWEGEGTSEAGEAKPIMVFFHGGAYGWGGTTDPMYDGQNFVKAHDDVILITCNYRLGLMSWADFSDIEGGEEYTDINLGLRDHIAALEWIADECSGYVYDGEIIPEKEDIDQAIEDAAKSGIQMIVGTNNDEWNYFQEDSEGETSEEKFASWVEGMDAMYEDASSDLDDEGKAALEELISYEEENVPEEYASDEEVKAALAKSGFVTEAWRYEILNFADKYADAGGDMHTYLWKIPSTKDEMYKSAVHAIELAYVFNNLDEDIYAGEVDAASAARVQESWTNFAKTGDPSIEEAEWLQYDTDKRETMVMEIDKWECVSDPSKTARELLTTVFGDEPYLVW